MKLAISLLALQLLAFIFWTVLSFVILKDIRDHAPKTWPTVVAMKTAFKTWRTDPETTTKARLWLALTIFILTIAALFANGTLT